jgi:hypothetical protein
MMQKPLNKHRFWYVLLLSALCFSLALMTPRGYAQDPKNKNQPNPQTAPNVTNKKSEDTTPSEKIPRIFDRNTPEPEDETPPPPKNAMVNFTMDPDRWIDVIYSQLGGSESSFEQFQRRRARISLNRIELICGLDQSIREKVQATADLEIQRFKTEVLTLASQAPRNPTQEEYQEFYNRIHKLTQKYQPRMLNKTDPFLWQKVLSTNLSETQQSAIKTETEKRTEYRDQTTRLETVLRISRRLGLTSKQREKLLPYTQSQPESWKTLERAWQTLQSFPDKEKQNLFSNEQIAELKKPLETTDELQLVVREFGEEW